jgi:hypothetical protein
MAVSKSSLDFMNKDLLVERGLSGGTYSGLDPGKPVITTPLPFLLRIKATCVADQGLRLDPQPKAQ